MGAALLPFLFVLTFDRLRIPSFWPGRGKREVRCPATSLAAGSGGRYNGEHRCGRGAVGRRSEGQGRRLSCAPRRHGWYVSGAAITPATRSPSARNSTSFTSFHRASSIRISPVSSQTGSWSIRALWSRRSRAMRPAACASITSESRRRTLYFPTTDCWTSCWRPALATASSVHRSRNWAGVHRQGRADRPAHGRAGRS